VEGEIIENTNSDTSDVTFVKIRLLAGKYTKNGNDTK
jgi:hypothetical protein